MHSIQPCFTLLRSNVLLAPPRAQPVNVSASSFIRCLCFFLSVWGLGNTAHCFRDPHQGAPPSSSLQHPSVPQSWNSAPLPAHLSGVTGTVIRPLSWHHLSLQRMLLTFIMIVLRSTGTSIWLPSLRKSVCHSSKSSRRCSAHLQTWTCWSLSTTSCLLFTHPPTPTSATLHPASTSLFTLVRKQRSWKQSLSMREPLI